MNKKEIFTNFYNNLYKEILNEYFEELNDQIKKHKKSIKISYILFSILPTLLFWSILFKKEYIFFFIIITILYNISILLFVKSSHKDDNKTLLNHIKYKILDDMITLITQDENSNILPDSRISKESFEKTNLFNLNNIKYTGSNYIQTTFEKTPVVLGDINIYSLTETTKQKYIYIGSRKFLRNYKIKKKKDIFIGCYIGSNMTRKNDSLIQIIPNTIKNNFFNNKINKYYNLCPYELKLENLDFSKKYTVYSNDEIKARMVLTLTMMEQINQLETICNNKKYIIFKNDGRYSIFLENFTIEDILNKNISINRHQTKELDNLYNIYNELSKIFEILSILNQKTNNKKLNILLKYPTYSKYIPIK